MLPNVLSRCYVVDKYIRNLLQVITELLAGDQVNVVAVGRMADSPSETSYYMGGGYTSLTGFQLRTGLAFSQK